MDVTVQSKPTTLRKTLRKNVTMSNEVLQKGKDLVKWESRGSFSNLLKSLILREHERISRRKAKVS